MKNPASINETLNRINEVLQSATDGPYSNYSCQVVSWDDVERGTEIGGSLSCWGANITDTRLYAKNGRSLFTIREDNWNERLAKVSSDDIALVASDEEGGGGCSNIRPVTLRTVLSNPSRYGGYAGLTAFDLSDEILDKEVSVRFQTTFLPVEAGDKSTLEFCPEAYNYNTMDDSNPRNLIFLCTTQGVAVQQDGKGAKKLYHHVKSSNNVHRYWLEAESSSHQVGGSQVETKKEKEDALNRGKATSSVIGVQALGTRFNVLMTIQVPLRPKLIAPQRAIMPASMPDCVSFFMYDDDYEDDITRSVSSSFFNPSFGGSGNSSLENSMFRSCRMVSGLDQGGSLRNRGDDEAVSSAARVSRGSLVDTWSGLTVKQPQRHPHEHITVTIVMYYTCSGGVPSEHEVKAAIDDLESLYQSLENGYLEDNKFDFMKSDLTKKDTVDIKTKLHHQPPPKPQEPKNFNVFPKNQSLRW